MRPKVTMRPRAIAPLLATGALVWAIGVYLVPAQANPPEDGSPPPPPGDSAPVPTGTPIEDPTEAPVTGELVAAPGKERAYTLSFDDGPDPKWTPKLLDILAEHRVKAIFCLVGTQVEANPDLVKRIAGEGHRLCNHSYKHDHLGGLDEAAIRKDLEDTNAAIKKVVPDAEIAFMRAPYGEWSPTYGEPGVVSTVAAELGMRSLFWNVDSNDWRFVDNPQGAGLMFPPMKTLLESDPVQQTGAVILLHDAGHADRSQSLRAVAEHLLPYFEQNGWKAVFPG
jgi:peptidoglycan/xylan/chitin deacetylase (PgdA/CDA1 family)